MTPKEEAIGIKIFDFIKDRDGTLHRTETYNIQMYMKQISKDVTRKEVRYVIQLLKRSKKIKHSKVYGWIA